MLGKDKVFSADFTDFTDKIEENTSQKSVLIRVIRA